MFCSDVWSSLGCNKAQQNSGTKLTLNNKDSFVLFNKHYFVNLLMGEDAISDDDDNNI